jgi:hypothetical protein
MMPDSTHDAAVDALPGHLSPTADGTVECEECGATGLRPLGHDKDCGHEYTPTRVGEQEGC